MRYNDVKFCAALAIACAGSVPAWAADPTFVGDWNVTFFWSPTARLAQPNALSSHPCQVRLPACRPRARGVRRRLPAGTANGSSLVITSGSLGLRAADFRRKNRVTL